MYLDLGYAHDYARHRAAELLCEAERNRLADLARGPRRPLRLRLADWLYAAAARVEGAPRQPVYQTRAA